MPLHYDTPAGLALIFIAGFIASAINAVAGGGTLISYPTMVGLGLADRVANATNAVALWPGSLSGAWGFREHLVKVKKHLFFLLPPTILGSIVGSLLLVITREELFKMIVPFLILLATLLLAGQDRIKAWTTKSGLHLPVWGAALLQFFVAVYGGYFGAGMGIMMLGIMSLYVDGDMNALNAVKNWLAVVINLGASIILFSQGLVSWIPCLALMSGALLGGYGSARIAQKVNPHKLRAVVVVYGIGMSVFYLVRVLTG